MQFDTKSVRKRARPDMEWVFRLIQKLYDDPELFSGLPVRINPLARRVGDRFVLSYIRRSPLKKETPPDDKKLSIRASPLIQLLLDRAREPISIALLGQEACAHMPKLNLEKTKGVIRELLSQQFLLPEFLPSLLSEAPFDDLTARIPKSWGIQTLAEKIKAYNDLPIGEGELALQELQKEMGVLAPAETFLQVDAAAEIPLQLPETVARALGAGLDFLWKISPKQSLPEYHGKFVEKYGTSRTVPLLQLLQELGPVTKSVHPGAKWKRWLKKNLGECMREKKGEIVIDSSFTFVEKEIPDRKEAPPSLDLFCELIADSRGAIEQGDFLALFLGIAWQGGSTMGRFLDILGKPAQEKLSEFIQLEEELLPNSRLVELSYFPANVRSANVTIHPCLTKHRLDLESAKGSLALEEIYIGTTGQRLYLTTKEGKSELVVHVGNLLNQKCAPPPLQLMRDISDARFHLPHPFSWGDLAELPFLPRIRLGKLILSSAEWNLHDEPFEAWAKKWNLPRYSFLTEGDQRLLIDQTNPMHIREIALRLKKGNPLKFTECIVPASWVGSNVGSHFHEIVVPFVKNPLFTETPIVPLSHFTVSTEERLKLPGSDWLFLKFYLDEGEASRFLVHYLAPLAGHLCQERQWIDHWFFIRYKDPLPHLRFRMHLREKNSLGPLLLFLEKAGLQWIQKGVIYDLSFGVYEREVERYGGIESMPLIENLFCTDSKAVVHLVQAFLNKRLMLPEPIFHTLSVLTFLYDLGLKGAEMLNVLEQHSDRQEALEGFRKYKGQLIPLVKDLLDDFRGEGVSLFKEASSLRAAQGKPLAISPSVYSSLLHMHCNRIGADQAAEAKASLFARHALQICSYRT